MQRKMEGETETETETETKTEAVREKDRARAHKKCSVRANSLGAPAESTVFVGVLARLPRA